MRKTLVKGRSELYNEIYKYILGENMNKTKKNCAKIIILLAVVLTALCVFTACEEEAGALELTYSNGEGEKIFSAEELFGMTIEKSHYTFLGWEYVTPDGTKAPLTQEVIGSGTLSGRVYVSPKFSPIEYGYTYQIFGETVASGRYTVENNLSVAPSIPAIAGYTAKWDRELTGGNVTVNAVYTPITYNISYDVGAYDEIANTNRTAFTVEESFSLAPLSRIGYEFLGWYDGEGRQVSAVTQGTAKSLHFTARWSAIDYTVAYNHTYGVAHANPTSFRYGAGFLPLEDIERDGYRFLGWFDRNGTQIDTIDTSVVGDIVLNARWEEIGYDIVPVFPSVHPEMADVSWSRTLVGYLPSVGIVSLPEATAPWYDFLGWYADADFSTRIYEADFSLARDVVVYGKWEVGEFTATFYVDGEETFTRSFDKNTQTFDEPSVPTKEGYVAEWSAYSTATGTDLTVTALYTPIEYTVTYYDRESEYEAKFTVETDTGMMNVTEWYGHRFLGWYEKEGDVYTEKVERIEKGTVGDFSVYAKWELVVYTITYENTKTADISEFITEFTIEDEDIYLPTHLDVDGYTFLGWEKDGREVAVVICEYGYDMTVTAVFIGDEYTVTLASDNKLYDGRRQVVNYDALFALPIPEMEGHEFLGWYDSEDANAKRITDKKGVSLEKYSVKGSSTFYSKYAINSYTVTFDSAGGSEVNTAYYEYGEGMLGDHFTEKQGFYFVGWFDEQGNEYVKGTAIKSDVNLTARWLDGGVAISDKAGLLAIKDNPDKNYYLTADIFLEGETWTPIENFSGILDGKGHKIYEFLISSSTTSCGFIKKNTGIVKDLTLSEFSYNVNVSSESSANINMGVLTAVNQGTIDGCIIEGGVIRYVTYSSVASSADFYIYLGAIAGINEGTIVDCYNSVDIESTNRSYAEGEPFTSGGINNISHISIGGIVGKSSGAVSSCINVGNVTVKGYGDGQDNDRRGYAYLYYYIGGVVGDNGGEVSACSSNAIFDNRVGAEDMDSQTNRIYNRCKVFFNEGGLVGRNSGAVESSVSSGAVNFVTIDYADLGNNLEITSNVGGLVGTNQSNGNINNSYSKTVVNNNILNAKEATYPDLVSIRAGGLIGTNSGAVKYSYASGRLNSGISSAYASGFVGSNESTGSINGCFSTGDVTTAGDTGNSGYFIGSNGGTVRNCAYLGNATLIIGGTQHVYDGEKDVAVRKNFSDFMDRSYMVDTLHWNENIWTILANEYPVFNWELNAGHTYIGTVVSPTCTEIGYTLHECTHCDRFYISNYVDSLGHTYTDDVTVSAPTCIEMGYTTYVCDVCGEIERKNYLPELGHTKGTIASSQAPTCTESGTQTYNCTVCDKDFDVTVPATGHTATVTKEKLDPTCSKDAEGVFHTTEGYTAETSCSVCHEILVESTVILPHDYTVSYDTAPTCTATGVGTYICQYDNCGHTYTDDSIPALGHIDTDGNRVCDRCSAYVPFDGDIAVVEISTKEQLIAINNDLDGQYRITANIDLGAMVWTPIGTVDNPFTGFLDGGNFIISNFILNSSVSGIIGYNSGVVHNVRVSGVTVNINDVNIVAGYVVGVNEGLVSLCTTEGTNTVNITSYMEVNTVADAVKNMTAIFGGIVGRNAVTGNINDCVFKGTTTVNTASKLNVDTKWSVNAVLNRDYKKQFLSTLTVYVAGIAGENNGNIASCTISSGKLINNATVVCDRSALNVGHAKAVLNYYKGSYAAVNRGEITDENGKVTYENDLAQPSALSESTDFWKREIIINVFQDGEKV